MTLPSCEEVEGTTTMKRKRGSATIKARCRDLYMRLQRGHPLLRGLPIANKIMAAIAEHLRSEFHLLLSLLYGVLVDLASSVSHRQQIDVVLEFRYGDRLFACINCFS